MALNDFTLFEEFALNIGLEEHQLETDVLKVGFVDDTITPLANLATPTWSDFSANEVATTGGYTTGGETITNNTYTEAAGVGTLDGDNIALVQNASGFTDARWGIVYNSTNGTGMAIGFIDFGANISEVAGPVAINWNGSGIATVTIA